VHDISAATDIVWHLLPKLKKGVAYFVRKSLAEATIALVGGGSGGRYTMTLNPSDTSGLTPSVYLGQLAIVISGVRYKFMAYDVPVVSSGDMGA
jgi:hypothetical protein